MIKGEANRPNGDRLHGGRRSRRPTAAHLSARLRSVPARAHETANSRTSRSHPRRGSAVGTKSQNLLFIANNRRAAAAVVQFNPLFEKVSESDSAREYESKTR